MDRRVEGRTNFRDAAESQRVKREKAKTAASSSNGPLPSNTTPKRQPGPPAKRNVPLPPRHSHIRGAPPPNKAVSAVRASMMKAPTGPPPSSAHARSMIQGRIMSRRENTDGREVSGLERTSKLPQRAGQRSRHFAFSAPEQLQQKSRKQSTSAVGRLKPELPPSLRKRHHQDQAGEETNRSNENRTNMSTSRKQLASQQQQQQHKTTPVHRLRSHTESKSFSGLEQQQQQEEKDQQQRERCIGADLADKQVVVSSTRSHHQYNEKINGGDGHSRRISSCNYGGEDEVEEEHEESSAEAKQQQPVENEDHANDVDNTERESSQSGATGGGEDGDDGSFTHSDNDAHAQSTETYKADESNYDVNETSAHSQYSNKEHLRYSEQGEKQEEEEEEEEFDLEARRYEYDNEDIATVASDDSHHQHQHDNHAVMSEGEDGDRLDSHMAEESSDFEEEVEHDIRPVEGDNNTIQFLRPTRSTTTKNIKQKHDHEHENEKHGVEDEEDEEDGKDGETKTASWRERDGGETVYDSTLIPFVASHLMTFLLTPLDKQHRDAICCCFIERDRFSPMKRLAPTFSFFVEEPDGSARLLMVARKKLGRSANYHIATSHQALNCKDPGGGFGYLGKLRGAKVSSKGGSTTEYVLYGKGTNPANMLWNEAKRESGRLRKEYATIVTNSSKETPVDRRIQVAIPALRFAADGTDDAVAEWRPRDEDETMGVAFRQIRHKGGQNVVGVDKVYCLNNFATRYDALSTCIIEYNKRATVASTKNTMLAISYPENKADLAKWEARFCDEYHRLEPGEFEGYRPAFRMGKCGQQGFNVDFRRPLSPFQAFGIALAQFERPVIKTRLPEQ